MGNVLLDSPFAKGAAGPDAQRGDWDYGLGRWTGTT